MAAGCGAKILIDDNTYGSNVLINVCFVRHEERTTNADYKRRRGTTTGACCYILVSKIMGRRDGRMKLHAKRLAKRHILSN